MAKVDSGLGYRVEVIDGKTHVYCMQKNGTEVDNVLHNGNNTLVFYHRNDNGTIQSETVTLKWTDVNSNSTFLAVGNPNAKFSVGHLSKIENSGNDMIYGYYHSGGAQTRAKEFNTLIHLFEDIAEANGMRNPTIATSGWSGSGAAAYTTARDSSSAKICILADPWSDNHNYNSGNDTYTLVLTSKRGHDEKRILNSGTRNTFIIELDRGMTYVHDIMYELVSRYDLTKVMTGDLNIANVVRQIKADGYDCNLIYIDQNGNIREHLDNASAQVILDNIMKEAGSANLEKIVEASSDLKELSALFKGNDGTLAANLVYINDSMEAIRAQIKEHSDITYNSESGGDAKVIKAMYDATNYYGSVNNLLYGKLTAETNAIYDIANAIFSMDSFAKEMAETTLTDGMRSMFDASSPVMKEKINALKAATSNLLDTAKNSLMSSDRYGQLKDVLGAKVTSGSAGRISITSLNSAVNAIVPALNQEVDTATALNASLANFMSGIGTNNVLQGGVWEDVKLNAANYQNLLKANEKAASFIQESVMTAMGIIKDYIDNAASSISAVNGTEYGSLATAGELDDSNLKALSEALTEMQSKIDETDATIKRLEASRKMVADGYTDKETGEFIKTGEHQEPSESEIQVYRDQLEKYKEVKTILDAYKGILEGFAPIVQAAQEIINTAIDQVTSMYADAVQDTDGNITFNANFKLDLSPYSDYIDTSKNYKQLISDYYDKLNPKTPETEPKDDNPKDTNPTPTFTGGSVTGGSSGDKEEDNPVEETTETETEIPSETTEVPSETRTELQTEINTEIDTEKPSIIIIDDDGVSQKPSKKSHTSHSSKGNVEEIINPITEPIIEEVMDEPIEEPMDIENEFLENPIEEPAVDIEQPTLPTVEQKDTSNLTRTMGIASGIGLAVGAAALGAHTIMKNQDNEEEEDDYGFDK